MCEDRPECKPADQDRGCTRAEVTANERRLEYQEDGEDAEGHSSNRLLWQEEAARDSGKRDNDGDDDCEYSIHSSCPTSGITGLKCASILNPS